jgi:uncharacterized protein
MPQLLNKYHSAEYWRGAAFPIGQRGTPVQIVDDLDEVFLSIMQILNTRKGERVMYPEFGSNLGPLLWEPHDIFLQEEIKSELSAALKLWEPRVILMGIVFDTDSNLLNLGILVLTIELRLKNNPRQQQVIKVPISSQGSLFRTS